MRHMREAGVAYEKLSGLRFATAHYPDDIWNSADCFYRGQSYSNTARLLDVYLKSEPEKRNAQALLRLGQSNLARGNVDQCIAALEECIELYPRDNASYQRASIARKPFRTAATPTKPNGSSAPICPKAI